MSEERHDSDGVNQPGRADGEVTRRQFLKVSGLAGAALVFGVGLGDLMAACAKSAPTTTAATTVLPAAGRVMTDKGPVVGQAVDLNGKTLHHYRGIPYAAPPVGALRFRPPQQVTAWTQTRVCTEFTHIAAQPSGATQPDPGLGPLDELLSKQMQTMWTNFAKTGDPSIPGKLRWPAHTRAGDKYLEIGDSFWIRSGFSGIRAPPPPPPVTRIEA